MIPTAEESNGSLKAKSRGKKGAEENRPLTSGEAFRPRHLQPLKNFRVSSKLFSRCCMMRSFRVTRSVKRKCLLIALTCHLQRNVYGEHQYE